MPIGTGYGNSGVPDFLVCHGGEFLAIEAKAEFDEDGEPAGKSRPMLSAEPDDDQEEETNVYDEQA
jgi:hypothetical protein